MIPGHSTRGDTMKPAILLAALLLAAPAGRDSALADEYIRLAHVNEMFDAMAKQAETELAASIDDVPCEALKPILRERNAEIARDSRAYLSSRQLHDRTVKLLQETYTDAELAQVNDALRSPGGRLLADKSPKLTMRLRDVMHEGDADSERKAQALDDKYRARLESVERQCESQVRRGRGGAARDEDRGDERDGDRRDDRDEDRRRAP
jgi:hypothetical protein